MRFSTRNSARHEPQKHGNLQTVAASIHWPLSPFCKARRRAAGKQRARWHLEEPWGLGGTRAAFFRVPNIGVVQIEIQSDTSYAGLSQLTDTLEVLQGNKLLLGRPRWAKVCVCVCVCLFVCFVCFCFFSRMQVDTSLPVNPLPAAPNNEEE